MLLTEEIETAITPENKIGEGRYRAVYRIGNRAVKIIKPFIRKYYGLFSINYSISLYTQLKFGINDFNEYEFKKYLELNEKIPAEFRDNFLHIFGTEKNNGNSISLCELILDSDGKISMPLDRETINSDFWNRLDRLEEFLLDSEIYFMDIRPENILARELNGSFIPVIIDYKKIDRQTYPFQIWLKFRSQIENKFRRRFQRLKELNK